MPAASILAQNRLAFAIRDAAPATPLHTLLVPWRHVASWFDLSDAERRAIDALVQTQRQSILASDPSVAGFNIAVNIGKAAGQTILHCHLHLVPRRLGDGDAIVLSGPHKRLIGAKSGNRTGAT